MRHPTHTAARTASPSLLGVQPRGQAGRCSMTLAQMMAMAARAHLRTEPTDAHRTAPRLQQQAASLSTEEWALLFPESGLAEPLAAVL